MEKLNSLSILVICDDMGTLRFFEKLLGDEWHVVHADSKEIALDILKHTKIHMIVMHDDLTGKDPADLCQQIRHLPGLRATPLFLITGNLKRSYMKKMVSAGVTDFLVEPLDEAEFRKNLATEEKKSQTAQKMSAIKSKIPTPSSESGKVLNITETLSQKPLPRKKIKSSDTMLLLHVLNYRIVFDTFGKAFEKEFKIRLAENLRDQDSVMKKGEGKFLILLPKTSQKGAELIAKMLKETLSKEVVLPGVGNCELQVQIDIVKEDTEPPEDYEEPFNISTIIGKRG